MTDLIKQFSGLSIATQQLSDHPSIISAMGVLGQINQVVKDYVNQKICSKCISEFKIYIQKYIDDPNKSRGDSDIYINNFFDTFTNKPTRIFFELVKATDYYNKGEYYKAGESIGDVLDCMFRQCDLSEDTKDMDRYTSLVTPANEPQFQSNVMQFKRKIGFCVTSFRRIFKDVYNFYNSEFKGEDVIPSFSDLLKSIVETNQLMVCFNNLNDIMSLLHDNTYTGTVTGYVYRDNNTKIKEERKKDNKKVIKEKAPSSFYN